MSSSQEFMTAALSAVPDICRAIEKGLKTGGYIREGGTILSTDGDQKVVALLRDAAGGQTSDKILAETLGMLTEYSSVLPLLNLSISTIGFVVVLQRLEAIEQKMNALTREMKEVSWKLDSTFYSDFQAGLKMANNAFEAKQKNNRRDFASQAINRFLGVESQYLTFLDRDLETTGGRWAAVFLHILRLAIVSETRCYLELGKLETAKRGLEKHVRTLVSPCEKYFGLVLGQNPAIFLHPDLADQVTLERMTRLWRHREPALTASLIFERLRRQMWKTAGQSPRYWVNDLPPSVRDWAVEGKKGLLTGLRTQGEDVFRRVKAVRTRAELPDPEEEQWRGVVPRLVEVFAQLESTYETLGRLRGFQSELDFLAAHDVSFTEWQRLTFPESQPTSYGLILPLDSELLAEQAKVPGGSGVNPGNSRSRTDFNASISS